jgi:hypothetical protein
MTSKQTAAERFVVFCVSVVVFFFFLFVEHKFIIISIIHDYFISPCCRAFADTKMQDAMKFVKDASEYVKRYRAERDAARQEVAKIQKALDKSKEENKNLGAKIVELEHKLQEYGRQALACGSLPKGLCSFVFVRLKNPHPFPDFLPQAALECQQQWNRMYPTNYLTSGVSGEFAYGETSFLTMARICHVIKSELQLHKPLQPGDMLLDWGCGAGKWLFFARNFLGIAQMVTLGIEAVEDIFRICQKNLGDVRLSSILHAESHTFTSFCPARVVVNYDGGNQAMQNTVKGRIHRRIMRTAFCSPTVDVVVSTRLNWDAFWCYFSKHWHNLHGSLWKCIYIEKCGFGGSRFTVNVWFRLTPMQNFDLSCIKYDRQMQKLISGLFLSSSDETYMG